MGEKAQEVLKRPTKAVQFPENKGVTCTDEVKGFSQTGGFSIRTAGYVRKDARAVGCGECSLL